MDKETIDRRNAHALQELIARGVVKNGKFPFATRVAMALIPGLRAPYYGNQWTYALVMGILFGLPFMIIIGGVFYLEEEIPVWPGLLIGAGAGAMFGTLMTMFMSSVHTRLKLTPWEDLDEPPGEAPEGAELYENVEGEFMVAMSRSHRHATRNN